MIVAMARNRVIGANGKIPWHLPNELQLFKSVTMGHHIIMGRKTYESIGRLLPGRTTVIVTRQKDYAVAGAKIAHTLEQAIALCAGDSEIFVIGGGAVLDLVCFAASTAHRGIRHVRFPTTTLSQGDGGVGVKNGVNYFGKKNWVGSFAVPFAVVNDFAFLESLPARERRNGIIEAIKVALIRDRAFFKQIEAMAGDLAALKQEALEQLIQRSAELHVEHIATGGDPYELGSARPLDFGHWAAHKLEQISKFTVAHGEAVAIGMAVDLVYSRMQGILDAETCERVLKLIESIGFATCSPYLMNTGRSGEPAILEGLEEFREHLGGELTVTLVPEIGTKVEVHEMNRVKILNAVVELQKRAVVVEE
jgi:3-dehydroquinate synthase